jgi:acyl-CoA synthetase (AMP-forming)/AMP-acid ligase II
MKSMHGNNVMKGYYNNPEGTASAFIGGWFHSGDIGVWHPDGYIELRDRAKDVIISGGENISTIEVEQVIAQHPAVLECAVIAIPDEQWGERPKAFVTVKQGQIATEQEIIAFCRDRLAHFKCPSVVWSLVSSDSTFRLHMLSATALTRTGREVPSGRRITSGAGKWSRRELPAPWPGAPGEEDGHLQQTGSSASRRAHQARLGEKSGQAVPPPQVAYAAICSSLAIVTAM